MKLQILFAAFMLMSVTFGLMVETQNKPGIALSLFAIFLIIALVVNECYIAVFIRKAKKHERK